MKNEKIGIYSRVSSRVQEDDGTSIDYQIKVGKKISKKLDMDFDIYNEGGKSSWDSNINTRPELVRLLQDVESGKLKSVWCWNMDRLGRNSQSWWSILKILVGWRVNLYIGENTKPYDFTSPTDRLVVNILSHITTYDNELRRMRMVFGKMEKLKKGQTFIGGTIPFGYGVDDFKNLTIHPEESKMVKKMYENYNSGDSTTDLQKMLDSSEFSPRRSKRGWNIGTIQKVLGNSIYKGFQEWIWKETNPDGTHVEIERIKINTPRIVSDKLWNLVKNKREQRSGHNQYDTDYHSLLKGFLVCSGCGLPMNHRMRKIQKNNYYYCVYSERSWLKRDKTNRVPFKHQEDKCSMRKSLIMGQTDEMVWDKFLQIFRESKWIKEEFKKTGMFPKGKIEDEIKKSIKSNQNKISKLKRRQDQLTNQIVEVELKWMNKEVTKPVYNGMLKNLNETLDSVSKEIFTRTEENEDLRNSTKWIDWVGKMNDEIDQMKDWSMEEKRQKLEQFIRVINVSYLENSGEHNLDFNFKVPLIGDKLVYKDNKDKSKGYDIVKGNNQISITYTSKSNSSPEKMNLIKVMSKLRGEGLSYSKISDRLNDDGITTIRGKKWSKHLVGQYINYISKDVSLVQFFNEPDKDSRGKKKR